MHTKSFATIAILVFASSIAAYTEVTIPGAAYVRPDTCRICHDKPATGDQWGIWKKSKHAQAYDTLRSPQAQDIASKAGIKMLAYEAPQCVRCHVTAYDSKTKSVPPEIQLTDAVGCQACHGPGSLHQEDGIKMMFHPDKASKINLSAHIIRPDEKTCVACHNPESPVWKPDKYTLPNGTKSGFDYKQAFSQIAHPVPGKAPWIK